MSPSGHGMNSKVVRAIREHRLGLTPTVDGHKPPPGKTTFEKLVLRLMGGRYGRRRF
jgi:hypothetical protein